jgi:hypothetical protein
VREKTEEGRREERRGGWEGGGWEDGRMGGGGLEEGRDGEGRRRQEHSFVVGKSTVAQLVSGILRSMGKLSKGHVINAKRDDFVGQYVGHTAKKSRDLIESARGGVLFIDEAYNLVNATDNTCVFFFLWGWRG